MLKDQLSFLKFVIWLWYQRNIKPFGQSWIRNNNYVVIFQCVDSNVEIISKEIMILWIHVKFYLKGIMCAWTSHRFHWRIKERKLLKLSWGREETSNQRRRWSVWEHGEGWWSGPGDCSKGPTSSSLEDLQEGTVQRDHTRAKRWQDLGSSPTLIVYFTDKWTLTTNNSSPWCKGCPWILCESKYLREEYE